jgi:flagellar motor switch protein FliM
MASLASPADLQAYIIERLVGDTGEPDKLTVSAQAMLERSVASVAEALSEILAQSVIVEPGEVVLTRLPRARPDEAVGYALGIVAGATSPDAMVLGMDAEAVALFVSAMFGADPALPISPIRRELSPIEIEVATAAMNAVARGMRGAGANQLDLKLPFAQATTGAELRKMALRDGPAVKMSLRLTIGAHSCEIGMTMPQRLLLRQGTTETAVSTAVDWGARFNEEVMRSSLTIEAMMPIGRRTLGDLSELAVGDILEFDEDAQANAALSARGRTLFVCEFGKLGQNYTLRIRQPFDAEQDLLEGLIRR